MNDFLNSMPDSTTVMSIIDWFLHWAVLAACSVWIRGVLREYNLPAWTPWVITLCQEICKAIDRFNADQSFLVRFATNGITGGVIILILGGALVLYGVHAIRRMFKDKVTE